MTSRHCRRDKLGLLIYRCTHSMYYANVQRLAEEIMYLVNTADPRLRWFCIDVCVANY